MEPMTQRHAWVLVHRYSDGSGLDVMRAYTSRSRAEQDLAVAKEHANDIIELHEVDLFEN